MMKKFFSLAAIAAVVASMTLTACSTSPEDYAKQMKDAEKALVEAQESKDEAKIEEAQKAVDELKKEIDAKCTEDTAFKAAYEKAYAAAPAEAAE